MLKIVSVVLVAILLTLYTVTSNGGTADDDRVSSLIKKLEDPDEQVREQAAYELRRIDWRSVYLDDPSRVDDLSRALAVACRDRNYRVSGSASLAITSLRSRAQAATPILLEGLRDEQAHQDNVIRALQSVGPIPEGAIPALERILSDHRRGASYLAARALADMKDYPAARKAAYWYGVKSKLTKSTYSLLIILGLIYGFTTFWLFSVFKTDVSIFAVGLASVVAQVRVLILGLVIPTKDFSFYGRFEYIFASNWIFNYLSFLLFVCKDFWIPLKVVTISTLILFFGVGLILLGIGLGH